jgi:ABC-type nitrate/sulfonate/bicarbonate transport system substrate-binding protein
MARLIVTVYLFSLLAGLATAQEQKLQRLNVVWSTIGGTTSSLWVTKDTGIFAKYGLDVQLILILASTRAASSIIAGDVDIGLIGSTAPVLARLAGSDLVVIGNSTTHAIFSLMTHPSITEISQLRGKTLGVVRFGSVSDIGLQHALRNDNIDPNRDVKLLQIGGIGEMLAAMKAGGIQGGLFPPPLSGDAKRLGFRELMDPERVNLKFAQSHLSVRQAYLKENSDTVRRFMKAWIEGIHYMKTHKDFTLNVLRKHTKSEDPSALEETYRIFAMKYLPPAPYPTEESVKTILELIGSSQPKAKTAQPKDFIDPSWVRELEESGFIKTLYR